MLDTFIEMMSYPFMVRAFLVGSLVALCSALLGVSLVLKRYSMIGDGLSHVGFGALAIAAALNMAPLAVAIPVVVAAAVLLLRISGSSKIKGDAAIALISTGALAIGIMVISMTTGMNTDVYNYMFGSILAMSGEDVQFSILLSAAVLILYLFFYNKIFAITFDETFARATGVRANLYNTLIAVLPRSLLFLSHGFLLPHNFLPILQNPAYTPEIQLHLSVSKALLRADWSSHSVFRKTASATDAPSPDMYC